VCESSAYLLTAGGEELLLENIALLEVRGADVELTGLLGDKLMVKARVKALSLVEHKILLEPMESGTGSQVPLP
jgi:predicted RNA-binding protein